MYETPSDVKGIMIPRDAFFYMAKLSNEEVGTVIMNLVYSYCGLHPMNDDYEYSDIALKLIKVIEENQFVCWSED